MIIMCIFVLGDTCTTVMRHRPLRPVLAGTLHATLYFLGLVISTGRHADSGANAWRGGA